MFDDLIIQASQSFNVPDWLIKTIIDVESSWNPNAYRFEKRLQEASYGLMQVLESTARGLGFQGDVSQLYDPATNINLGTSLLAQLRSRYTSDESVFSAYNSGNPDLWKTSSQVGAYVAKAKIAAEKYFTVVTQTVEEYPSETAALVLGILLVVVLWIRNPGG